MTNQRQPTEPGEPARTRDRYGGEPERNLAAQARAFREKLGMTQEQVASEMSARGRPMRQSTIAKIEAGQRPVRVNEAVLLAAVLHASITDMLTEPGQQAGSLAAAREEERELLGLLLQASRRLEDITAAYAAAQYAMRDAESRVEVLRIRYAEAQAKAEALAAGEGDES